MLTAILTSEIFWSAVIFAATWGGSKLLGFFVTKYPALKALDLAKKWEKIIALGDQWRRDKGYANGGKDEALNAEVLQAHIKSLCNKYKVNYSDVTAHRRKIKDESKEFQT